MNRKLHTQLMSLIKEGNLDKFFELLDKYFKGNKSLEVEQMTFLWIIEKYQDIERVGLPHYLKENTAGRGAFPNEGIKLLQQCITFTNSLFKIAFFLENNPLKEGKVTYAIPSEMNLKRSYTCSIKIAFDLETLLKDLDHYENAYSEAENLLVSSKLKVDVYDVDNEFQIKWLCPQTQTLVKEKSSEWIFSVKPLTKEESCLYFCVSAFLDNSEDKAPHVKVFSRKIKVKVNNSLEFMPSLLLPSVVAKNFEILTDKSIYSSVEKTIDEIVGLINEVEIYQAFEKIDEVMKDEKHPHIEVLRKGYIHGDAKFDFYDRFKTCVRCVLFENLATA